MTLQDHTELLNTLTDSQLGTKPDTQTHDDIYSLFPIIQQDKYTLDKPTYVAFANSTLVRAVLHHCGGSHFSGVDDSGQATE